MTRKNVMRALCVAVVVIAFAALDRTVALLLVLLLAVVALGALALLSSHAWT